MVQQTWTLGLCLMLGQLICPSHPQQPLTVTVYSANQSNLQTNMLKIQSTNLQVKQGIGLQSTVSNGSKSCLQSTIILPILSTIYIQNLGQIYNLQNDHTLAPYLGSKYFSSSNIAFIILKRSIFDSQCQSNCHFSALGGPNEFSSVALTL